MLTRLTIKGYRSRRDVTLDDLGPVTALIGRNASGKSNVLRGIAALAQIATCKGRESPVWREITFNNNQKGDAEASLVVSAEVAVGDQIYQYDVRAGFYFSPDPKLREPGHVFEERLRVTQGDEKAGEFDRMGEQLHLGGGDELRAGPAVSSLIAIASLLPAKHPAVKATEPLWRFFGSVRYVPLDEPNDGQEYSYIISHRMLLDWQAEYRATGSLGSDVALQILNLWLSDRDKCHALADQVGMAGLGVISTIHVAYNNYGGGDEAHNTYVLRFQLPPETGGVYTFGELSQGTRRIIRLATALAYDDASQLLVEHPEDGIHRGLVRKVAGMLTHGLHSAQVVVSTHSDTLLDELGAEQVRFVTMTESGTSVRKLGQKGLEAAAHYLDKEDGNLAEFLHAMED